MDSFKANEVEKFAPIKEKDGENRAKAITLFGMPISKPLLSCLCTIDYLEYLALQNIF